MTRAELARLIERMAACWPQAPPSDLTAAKIWEDLKDLPGEQVLSGLEACYRDGREWPPNGAQVRAKVIELGLDVPDWATVKSALARRAATNQVASREPCPVCNGDLFVPAPTERDPRAVAPCACRERQQDRVRQARHPLVSAFLESVGREEFADVDGDRTAEAQVREKWLAFVNSRRRDIAYEGMPGAGLRQLERVQRSPRQLSMAMADSAITTDPE